MQYISLNRNADFLRAYKKGRSFVHPLVVLYVNKNWVGHTRIGITASKKVGGAVQRNRARRLIRTALSQLLLKDVGNVDFVLVARGQTPRAKSTQLVVALASLFKNAGINLQEGKRNI